MNINYVIRPILTGFQVLDKGQYATYRRDQGIISEYPVFAFLIEGGGRKILVDTGMSDTEQSVKYHHNGRQEPGQAIHDQLANLGVAPEDIEIIIFTHLHWDHCYNMKRFTKARLYVSEEEYKFALDPIPPYWVSYEHRNAGLVPPFDGCHFNLIHGEEEIVEGIRAFPTPGHSPGHQAISVQTEKGLYVLVGDLFFVRENLVPDEERRWPLLPIARFANLIDLWKSSEKVLRRADYVLMTHDPSQIGKEIFPKKKKKNGLISY